MLAKIVILLVRCARARADARTHEHVTIGTVPFYFRSPCAEPRETSSQEFLFLWLASDSLPLSLPYRLGLAEPFLFVAVDGISSQLELDLSNPRVIALPARFSSFFPHAFLLTQNLSFYPVGGWAPRRVPRSFSLDVLNDVIEILTMNGKEYIYI